VGLQPINHTEHDVPGAAGVSRPGSTSHAEAGLDLAQYLRPLEQAHASALHGRGIAAGLAVTAAPGTTTLRVAPGVALDAQGRHIVLAPGGSVETADDPDQSSRLVPITEAGVELSTVGRSGPGLVVVQWRETFDTTLLGGGNDRFVTRHTPWLQLTGTTLDPQRDVVVLATVVLDAGGLVTAGGVTPDRRDTLALGSGGLQLRAATASGSTVAEADAAALRPRPGGGLDVQVSPGAPTPLSVTADGRVGIGTTTPGELLDVAGSVSVTGSLGVDGALGVAGSLDVDGPLRVTDRITTTRAVGVGVSDPGFLLDVAERIRLRQGETQSAGLWLFQQTPQEDRAFVGMANDDQVGLWGNTGIGWGLLMHTTTGRVDVTQDLAVGRTLEVRKSGGANAAVTGLAFANEADFTADNLKVVMGNARIVALPFGNVDPFQFMVGYRRFGLPFGSPRFVRVFSVDQDGNAFFAGGKGGYVVDYFVNAVGDDLEQGDVVVLRRGTPAAFYGSFGAIPIPEVDLTDQPYDTRVCGIVADVVGPGGLPTVDEEPPVGADGPGADERGADQPGTGEPVPHPLARYAAEADQPRTTVRDRQMGRMVTLGAWAHCKVDADVAPIEAGDLLTTSATPGHAQKVAEPGRTPGAVVGKAMAPLASGRGTIPVLVTLH